MSLTVKAFAILIAALATPGFACPYCKVAGGELGNDLTAGLGLPDEPASRPTTQDAIATQSSNDRAEDALSLRFGLAADVSNAYFRHGYMQQDRGVVFQPTFSISTDPIERHGWTFNPYVVWFNSFHTSQSPGYAGGHGGHTRVEQRYQEYLDGPHAGAPYPHYHSRLVDVIAFDEEGSGWFETELKPGVVLSRGPLIIDLNVMGSIYPSGFHDPMIELGLRASYDLASLWDSDPQRPFSLRLNAAITHELRDDNGGEETVFEPTLEPSYRFNLGDYRVTLSLPIGTGLSPNGYYQDADTNDETFGYVSLGLKTTIQLPVEERGGRWFINAGITWYHFLADSAIFVNGDEDGFAASIGVGLAF